jgi:cytochrome c
MNSPVALGLAVLALIWSAGLARAEQYGTATEAKFMLERAVALLAVSKVTALSEFNDEKDQQFHDRDLYVFCMNISDAKFTAHPNPAMIGTDARSVKINDDPFGQRIYDAIKGVPQGNIATVDYMFPIPGTTEPVSNESFVMRAGDQGCAVTYYK